MNDLELIFFFGNVKNITRTWNTLGFVEAQNVAEHSYRMTLISLLLARRVKERNPLLELNISKILIMSLIHDIPETLCGDLNTIQKPFSERKEDLAFNKIFSEYTDLETLWVEYRDKKSIESKIVHDSDKLEALIEMVENFDKYHSIFSKFMINYNREIFYLTDSKKWFDEIYNEDFDYTSWLNHFN